MKFKSATDLTVLCHMLLLIGLAISGALLGIGSDIAYILAFLLPSGLGLFLGKRLGASPYGVSFSQSSLRLFLPTVFPSVILIMAISTLCSFILSGFGAENSVTVYPSFGENLIRHVLLPALFEETIFRYLPMSLMSGENRRGIIIVSSLSFALIHCNLFQIPYAFAAGVIFMLFNLALESPLPSLILHLVNNLMSVISIFYGIGEYVAAATLVLAAISAVFIIRSKERYIEMIRSVFCDKRQYKFAYSLFLIIIPTLAISILNLLG